MKALVLSDIHGNAAALEVVLEAAAEHGAEHIVNCGDLIGYYYQPDRVLSLLSEWPMDAVRGNHEDMLRRAVDDSKYLAECTARYGHGLEFTLERLLPRQVDWLVTLPATLKLDFSGFRMLLAHGTPQSTDGYLYPDASENDLQHIDEECALQEDLVVVGHTHYQNLWRRSKLRILNPGSVGQPRDRLPGAAWAMIDTETGEIELHREAYDASEIVQTVRRVDPALPYLWEVLERK